MLIFLCQSTLIPAFFSELLSALVARLKLLKMPKPWRDTLVLLCNLQDGVRESWSSICHNFSRHSSGGKKCLDQQEGTKVRPNLSVRACIQNHSLQTIHTLNNCLFVDQILVQKPRFWLLQQHQKQLSNTAQENIFFPADQPNVP